MPPGSEIANPWYLIHDPAILPATQDLPFIADLVVVGALLLVVVIRWARASGPLRRSLTPVLLPAAALFAILIVSTATVIIPVPDDVRDFLDVLQLLARLVLPIGFLIGILRTRMARSAVADLVVDLGSDPTPGRLGEALANALGDPTLEVGYWSDFGVGLHRRRREAAGASGAVGRARGHLP